MSAIPFGGKTVTLLHKEGKAYVRYTLEGCSWAMKYGKSIADSAFKRSMSIVCRIPYGAVQPMPGDLLILGKSDVEAANDIEVVRLLDSFRMNGKPAFRVLSVKDNANGAPLPHWKVEGD